MRLAIRFSIFFLIISQTLFLTSIKANQYRSRASGNWASSTTWSISTDGGATWSDAVNTPGTSASDTVLIRDAGTVTINTSTTIKKLTVGEGSSGVLQFDGTVRTFIVTDDITIAINGTLQGPNSGSLTSILRMGGNLLNNGIFNMVTGSDRLVDVTFNKNGNQTISGSGTTTFNRIVLDMGTSKANTLDIQSVITMAQASGSPTLTLTNGTFKLSSASTIRPFGGTNTTIGSTAGYHLNHASAISNWGNQASLIVNGDLIIANGTMTISVSGSANRLQVGSTGYVTISNGSLTLNGRLLATTSGGVFNITNGTFEIAAGGGVNSAGNSIFEVANNTFTMSGGTVSIASNNANTTLPDVNINQTGNPITGGTFKITCGSSAKIITVSSNVPFYDFQIQNGSAAVTARLRNNTLQVANNLTITSGTLDAATNNIDIYIKGNWSNSGAYSTGSNNVTFNGTSGQGVTKSGGETFYNLVVNKS
ncbi:MAG: hypothetical protein HY800_05855 [Ignavibacteriales bacterium]|nr:hypothetical protein [Ignavibacteriales bacterium]